jgi:hypothetical protein
MKRGFPACPLSPGDRLAFRAREDGTVVVEAETVDIRALRGILKPKRKGVTVEAMNAAIRRTAGR